MLDLKALANNFDETAARLAKKKVDKELLIQLKSVCADYKATKLKTEELRAVQNEKSRLFPIYKQNGQDTEALKQELDKLKLEVAQYGERLNSLEANMEKLALVVPNTPSDDVPQGEDEEGNVLLRTILQPRVFDFEVKDHVELGEKAGWLDFERGAKLAKSRFVVLHSEAAKLERALANFMLDFNGARGFLECSPPYIVNGDMMQGTGQLPKFEDDLFSLEGDEQRKLYLIPTAEVPLTNLFNDEILEPQELPIKLTAHTPCFRKEAGSAGRDTRGMIRQHQFHKVELVAITAPQNSEKVFDEMVSCASDMLTALGLPHRLMLLCGGDMGFSAAKTIDLEVWIPSQNKYREISSVSNCGDFQARRAKIRFRDGKTNRLVHTLNGSSLAIGRTLVALMENYQNADGTITIPEILRKYI